MRKYNNILVLSLLSLTLVGCNGKTPITDLKEKVEKRKGSVVGQVDPIPQFKEGTFAKTNPNIQVKCKSIPHFRSNAKPT